MVAASDIYLYYHSHQLKLFHSLFQDTILVLSIYFLFRFFFCLKSLTTYCLYYYDIFILYAWSSFSWSVDDSWIRFNFYVFLILTLYWKKNDRKWFINYFSFFSRLRLFICHFLDLYNVCYTEMCMSLAVFICK